jgi:hypothetical protein
VLEQIAFIEIGQHAYKPSQLCDRENPLFLAGYPHLILPDEFYKKETNWLPFLKFLNLRVSPNAEDILDLANVFAKQFQNGSINTPKFDELAKLLVKELSSEKADCPIFERIKKVNFIPSYFYKSPRSIHLKVFSPIATKQSATCCIHDSYFKEHLDLVWTTNAILPDYCRDVSDLLKIPDDKPSCSLVVSNFIEILKRCSNEQFIRFLI